MSQTSGIPPLIAISTREINDQTRNQTTNFRSNATRLIAESLRNEGLIEMRMWRKKLQIKTMVAKGIQIASTVLATSCVE
jgi:hypothetical protein